MRFNAQQKKLSNVLANTSTRGNLFLDSAFCEWQGQAAPELPAMADVAHHLMYDVAADAVGSFFELKAKKTLHVHWISYNVSLSYTKTSFGKNQKASSEHCQVGHLARC